MLTVRELSLDPHVECEPIEYINVNIVDSKGRRWTVSETEDGLNISGDGCLTINPNAANRITLTQYR